MGIIFEASADKHGISHEDALYAVMHAVARRRDPNNDSDTDSVFAIGPQHAQTNHLIEVIFRFLPTDLSVYPVQPLSSKFRHILEDGNSK